MARVLAALLCAALLAGGAAAHDCKCLYAGGVAKQGETRCIKTSDGPRLARCEMVLNNSSWTVSKQTCDLDRMTQRSTPMSYAEK